MNTRSSPMSCIAVPGFRSMYVRARSAASRAVSSAMLAGSGTRSVTGTTMLGLVPQETYGTRSAASISSWRS